MHSLCICGSSIYGQPSTAHSVEYIEEQVVRTAIMNDSFSPKKLNLSKNETALLFSLHSFDGMQYCWCMPADTALVTLT